MDVNVNVYDLGNVNKYVGWLGMGAFHTGVMIGEREYTFSNGGVIFHTPFEAGPEATFKESIYMGEVGNMAAVNAAVANLRATFAPGSYNLVRQNCNNFSDALIRKLFNKGIPSYINRSARFGSSLAPKDTIAGQGQEEPKSKAERAKEAKEAKEAAKKKAAAANEKKDLTDKQRAMLDKLKKKKKPAAEAATADEQDEASAA